MNAALKPAANAASRHKRAYTDNPFDWYVEEAAAVYALFDVIGYSVQPAASILDPCAGLGTIPACCRAWGLGDVTASDIAMRDVPSVDGGIDFFACPTDGDAALNIPPYRAGQFDWIISNPPYYSGKGPVAFLERALPIARIGVAMLVNLPFLASQSRNTLFNQHPPHALVFLSKRPSMPPGEELRAGRVKQKGGKEDYVWLVWSKWWGSAARTAYWPVPRDDYPPPHFPPGVFLDGREG